MGCNKSISEQIYKPKDSAIDTVIASKQEKSVSQRFISKEIGSINEHYKILKAIGTTSTGTFLYAQDIQSGTSRAIREISKSLLQDSPNMLDEVSILSELDHPNIVKVFQTIETNINYYIVFELLDGGTLKSKITRSGNEMEVSKHMHDVLSALYYMHIRGIVHCDLTPTNILFSSNESEAVPKIVSFSSAQSLSDIEKVDIKKLSYIYISPDILKKEYTEKMDMWSIGVIIYELLVGKHPYAIKDRNGTLKDIFKGRLDFTNPNFINLSFNAQDILKKLLIMDPEERLSAKDALAHPWLSQTTKESYYNYKILDKLRTFKVINK